MPRALIAVSQRAAAVSQRAAAVSQRCIVALLRRITAPKVAPAMIQLLYRDLHRSPRAQADRVVRVAGRIATLLPAPLRTRLAVLWPGAPVVSRYNMLYRDQDWEMGSSPPNCQKLFFFFTHFFFVCYSYCKTIKKYILLLFHFLVEPNKFIKIYFIYFFSSLTQCKTSEKIFLNTFFFLCAIHQAHKSHNIHNTSCYTPIHT